MIDLAQIKDKVLARLNAITPTEWEQRLRAKGWEGEVVAKSPEDESSFTLEYSGQYSGGDSDVVVLTQNCGSGLVFLQAVNSNELALAA